MQNGIIIEIAVVNACAIPLPVVVGAHFDGPFGHYWRIRFVEDGKQADVIEEIDDLRGMARQACEFMRGGEAVAWRYYETGTSHSTEVFA